MDRQTSDTRAETDQTEDLASAGAAALSSADVSRPMSLPLGFKIQGENDFDEAGFSVASAGDVNGDGIADLIVGARTDNSGGNNAGAAYVVFGTDQGFPAVLDLAAVAQGQGGFKIQGENSGDLAGESVASAGDVNGDGIDDLMPWAFKPAST